MMNSSFIDAIAQLGKDSTKPELVEIEGVTYTNQKLHDPRTMKPESDTLKIHTLTGIVDYIKANKDALKLDEHMIQVLSPVLVKLVSKLSDHWKCRDLILQAHHVDTINIFLNDYHAAEWFNVSLQCLFGPSEDKDKILSIIGNIREESVRTTADDGTTQNVTAAAGIVKVADVAVPNPVYLRPYRTFPEVDHLMDPTEFVLRMRPSGTDDKPKCALFGADGGRWEIEAMQRIRTFLADALPEITIVA